ncbi:MAG: hypothetical protein KGQ93_01210 [Cyanobacteria bacterium REEB459]|nr:hypothetical protein [Cyanobacteria bacterium REEB459]
MVQPLRRSSPTPSASLFAAARQPGLAASVLGSTRSPYRPFVLVGLFWMVLLTVAALAYRQLMASPPSPTGPALSAATASPTPPASPATDRTLPPLASPTGPPLERAAPKPPGVSRATPPLSPGWLLCFLGLCALGCFGISQQLQRPRRRRLYARGRGSRPRSVAPKRLSPYSPQRDSMMVPQATVPAPFNQQAPASPPQASPNPATTIVPDGADLPLDWPEASIAHNLDLRQRRSLSSWL